MKKKLLAFTFVGIVATVVGTVVFAALIGVGGFNRRPLTKYLGDIAFDASTGLLQIVGVPTTTDFGGAGGLKTHAANPPSTLNVNVQINDPTGSSYQGVPPHAFIMSGAVDANRNGIIEPAETGVMLTGDLLEMGFHNVAAGKGDDAIDFRFKVTGGFLAPLYAGQNIGVYGTMANNPWPQPVSLGHFEQSFTGTLQNGGVMPIKCGTEIGDFVWNDQNANGIQDPGEPGINGVTIRLRDGATNAVLATTTTGIGPLNQQGFYLFSDTVGFCAGTWKVELDMTTVPAGFVPTAVGAPGSTTATDSNGNPSVVVLTTDISKDRTIDFGFRSGCDGRIGNFVWHDLNRNGIQDSGEPGIDGVMVRLHDASNAVVGTTTTTSGGGYQFTGLCPGTYSVEIDASTLPAGFAATTPNAAGSTPDNDSSDSPATTTLSPGHMIDDSVDFGYVTPCTAAIGDFVWHDKNQNGQQDAGEPGIVGVTVNLLDAGTDAVVATTVTGAGGFYQFTGVCGGDFKVQVDSTTLPPGLTPTLEGAAPPAVDSNPNPTILNLPEGAIDMTVDFGYIAPCTGEIGDFVWHDDNLNGIQDAGEAGFDGVTVNLRKASDHSVIQTDITESGGLYRFNGLCPGNYIVEVVPPAGTIASPTLQGGNTNVDSNPNLFLVNLAYDDSSDLSVDFGFLVANPKIDVVKSATPLTYNTVGQIITYGYVVTNTGNVTLSTVTLTDDKLGVIAGCAAATLAPGASTTCSATHAITPADLAAGSITNIATGTGVFNGDTLTDDDTKTVTGVPCTGTVGNFVWNDMDNDGIQDAGEPGIAGVTVQLKDSNGNVIQTTTTDANGLYQFSGLCAGTYTVVVPNPPTDYTASPSLVGSNPAIDSNGSPATVVLPADNSSNDTIDFGFHGAKTFSIGPSSMEGNLSAIRPGDWVSGGYSFKFVNSAHIATSFTVAAVVRIAVTCPDGGGPGGTIVVPLGTKTYAVPAGYTGWLPTGDANNVLSWMGSVQAPDICSGKRMDDVNGAVYVATVAQNPPTGTLADFRFKYRDPNAKGKGNVNCLDTSDPRRAKADVCGASWSATVRDP